jgi:hypothetical protein
MRKYMLLIVALAITSISQSSMAECGGGGKGFHPFRALLGGGGQRQVSYAAVPTGPYVPVKAGRHHGGQSFSHPGKKVCGLHHASNVIHCSVCGEMNGGFASLNNGAGSGSYDSVSDGPFFNESNMGSNFGRGEYTDERNDTFTPGQQGRGFTAPVVRPQGSGFKAPAVKPGE